MVAASRGSADCLRLLLAADATATAAASHEPLSGPCSVAIRSYHDGYTPLHAAVISRSLPCLELLLAARNAHDHRRLFEPSTQNKYNQTALHAVSAILNNEGGPI